MDDAEGKCGGELMQKAQYMVRRTRLPRIRTLATIHAVPPSATVSATHSANEPEN
jgi:hypothetical protein